MKKIPIGILFIGYFVANNAALAEKNTFSLGYAQSKVNKFKNIKGMNIQYRYELNSPISILSSLTYLSGSRSESFDDHIVGISEHTKLKVKSYSMQLGPAYRFTNIASAYTTIGINYAKVKNTSEVKFSQRYVKDKNSENSTSFAYGAGVIINPHENISANIGYEGTRIKLNDKHYGINGFNIGVGYRF